MTVMLPALLGLALSACGSEKPSGGSIADAVPAGVPFFAEGAIRPSGELSRTIEALASHFPKGDHLGETVIREFDQSVEEASDVPSVDFTYRHDVEPWLGERAGVFVTEFSQHSDGAVLLEVTDEAAARAAIEQAAKDDTDKEVRREYGGSSYLVDEKGTAAGLVGGYLIFGSEADLRDAVDVAGGQQDSLLAGGALDHYGEVGEDSEAAYAYIDLGAILQSALQQSLTEPVRADRGTGGTALASYVQAPPAPVPAAGSGRIEATLEVQPAAAVVDATTTPPSGQAGAGASAGGAREVLDELPADSFVAAAIPGFGRAFAAGFEAGLSQQLGGIANPDILREGLRLRLGFDPIELARALGDAGFFVEGGGEVGGGAVAQVEDRDTVEDAVSGAGEALRRQPGLSVSGLPASLPPGASGFVVEAPGTSEPLVVALSDDRLAIVAGERAASHALSSERTLADTSLVRDAAAALGQDLEPSLVVDVPGLLDALASEGAASSPDYRRAEPYLRPLDLLAAASSTDDEGRLETRAILTVR